MVYVIRWRMNINNFNNFILKCSSKKETSLVPLVCWNILFVGFMCIYIYMFWTYGIRLCFMHVIMDHSMHDERNSTSFAHSNGKNRNVSALNTKPKLYTYKNSKIWCYSVYIIYIYICRIFLFKRSSNQKSTDRIFRLAVPALLAVTFYKDHILGTH